MRERIEDISDIVYYCIKGKGKKITNDAIDYLKKQNWEGNIRQLKSVVESAALNSRKIVTVRNLVNAYHQHKTYELENISVNHDFYRNKTLEEAEKDYIISVLENCHWYVEPAEKILKISRASLYRKINQYGLKEKICGYSQK